MNRNIWLVLSLCFHVATRTSAQGLDDRAAWEVKVKPVIEKSMKLLRSSARLYTEAQECFSCHHQALPVMTLQLARQRGVSTDGKTIIEQARFTREYYQQRLEKIEKGSGIPGGSYSAGYALLTLAAADSPTDPTRDAMVRYLQKKQGAQGNWRIGTHRPPLEDSDFTATAVSLAGIQWVDRQSSPDQRRQVVGRARKWLRGGKPKTTEDRVFQLFGLAWGQAGREVDNDGPEKPVDPSERDLAGPLLRRPYQYWSAVEDASMAKAQAGQLLGMQRKDGGWAQLATLESDAYATGQVLCCLYVVGAINTEDQAFRRAAQYLLDSQGHDGSWLVQTRSKPIQTYFESGFPHGKSQFISIAGSSWATMALLLSIGETP